MTTYRLLSPLQRVISLAVVMSAALMLFYGANVVFSAAALAQERVIDNQIPEHLPIKIKIKNLDKVKKLDNENWVRDLEIEVENIGDKPIYHLLFSMSLLDVLTENNRNLGFPIRYGRADLTDFTAPLQSDDVPIKPGEKFTFTIPEQLQRGWERFSLRRNFLKKEAKKARLVFQLLNFGDGTGFNTTSGLPVDIHKKRADGSCSEDRKKGENAASAMRVQQNRSPDRVLQLSTLFLPAAFLPVNFYPATTLKPASSGSLIRPDVCCPGSPCSHLKDLTVTCCGMSINKADSAPCTDPAGGCRTYYTEDVSCMDEFGTYCIQ